MSDDEQIYNAISSVLGRGKPYAPYSLLSEQARTDFMAAISVAITVMAHGIIEINASGVAANEDLKKLLAKAKRL